MEERVAVQKGKILPSIRIKIPTSRSTTKKKIRFCLRGKGGSREGEG